MPYLADLQQFGTQAGGEARNHSSGMARIACDGELGFCVRQQRPPGFDATEHAGSWGAVQEGAAEIGL